MEIALNVSVGAEMERISPISISIGAGPINPSINRSINRSFQYLSTVKCLSPPPTSISTINQLNVIINLLNKYLISFLDVFIRQGTIVRRKSTNFEAWRFSLNSKSRPSGAFPMLLTSSIALCARRSFSRRLSVFFFPPRMRSCTLASHLCFW